MRYIPMDKMTIFALVLGLARELKIDPDRLAERASNIKELDLYSADILAALIKAGARKGEKVEIEESGE